MIDLKNKRLYRSPRQALVLGIAAGLAQYLEVDPVFVRLVWLVAAIFTHVWPAILLYVVLFVVVPIDPAQDSVPLTQEPKDVTPAEPTERMDEGQNM